LKRKIIIKKLNEDDILEIVLEHYQEQKEFKGMVKTKGQLFGTPGKDLRFIGVYGDDTADEIFNYDLEEIDKKQDYNGDHSFFDRHPDFLIPSNQKKTK
jgi:hypothetical protein